MRVNTAYQFDSYSMEIDAAASNVYTAGQQVTTGKRINTPSDDPTGITTVLSGQAILSGISQYTSNLNTGKDYLNFSVQGFSDASTVVNQAYTLALSGANAATTQDGRNAMVAQITELQSQLASIANTQGAGGKFVFGGQQNATAPFTVTATGLTYNGDNNNINVETGPGQTMTVNSQAGTLFTGAYQALENLKNDLTGGNLGAISGIDVTALQTSVQGMNTAQGQAGAKLQTISELSNRYERQTTELTASVSNVEDVDLSSAITKYTQAQTAYQAALAITGQLGKLSLLNYM